MNPRCPICHRELAVRSAGSVESGSSQSEAAAAQPSAHPFCSPRCKLIDLGNWLDGNYRIPGPIALSDDDAEGADLPS